TQPVAGAADGLDRLVAELLPQIADVDVDDIRPGIEVEAPHPAEQLGTAEDLVGVFDEDLEESEFAGAELDGAIADVGAAGADVDGDVAGPQHRRLLRVGGTQAQPDAGEELVEGEGFAHVVRPRWTGPRRCPRWTLGR